MSTRIGDYVMCSDYDIIQLTRPRCVCRVIVFVLLSHTALLRALGTHRDAQLSRMPLAQVARALLRYYRKNGQYVD